MIHRHRLLVGLLVAVCTALAVAGLATVLFHCVAVETAAAIGGTGATFLIALGTALGWNSASHAQLARAEEALQASRSRLLDFMQIAVEWFWETDRELRFTFISSRFYQLTGTPTAYAVGRTKTELLEQYLADSESMGGERWRRLDELLQSRESYLDMPLRLSIPDGADMFFLSNGKPFFGEDGTFSGYRGAAIPIATRQFTGRQGGSSGSGEDPVQSRERMSPPPSEPEAATSREDRLATMGQMTATVAHELRNPLGAILTSTAVLRMKTTGAALDLDRALDRIERSVTRCDRIITELLDYARAKGPQLEETDIDLWLQEMFEELEYPSGVLFWHRLNLEGAQALVDREALRRAIINLVDNACQAMTEGNVWGSVGSAKYLTITTRRNGGRIEIEVGDTGPGIPDAELPQVMEPLFSTREGGTGLGLPTVQQIMDDHGGGLEINTVPGLGTRVVLWLPAPGASGLA